MKNIIKNILLMLLGVVVYITAVELVNYKEMEGYLYCIDNNRNLPDNGPSSHQYCSKKGNAYTVWSYRLDKLNLSECLMGFGHNDSNKFCKIFGIEEFRFEKYEQMKKEGKI